VLMSGYHDAEPGARPQYPRLDKPFTRAGLLDVLRITLGD